MCRAIVLTGTPSDIAKAKRLASRFFTQIQTLSSKTLGECAIALFMPANGTVKQNHMRKVAFETAMQKAAFAVRSYEIPSVDVTAVPDPVASPCTAGDARPEPAVSEPVAFTPKQVPAAAPQGPERPFTMIDFSADVPDIEVFAEEHFGKNSRRY